MTHWSLLYILDRNSLSDRYIVRIHTWVGKLKLKILTIASKNLKWVGINITKDAKQLYTENRKTLLRGIQEDWNKWEIRFVHALEDLMFWDSCSPWLDLWNPCNHRQNPSHLFFLEEINRLFWKCIWKREGSWISKKVFKRRAELKNLNCLILLNLKTCSKATAIKVFGIKTDQWNRIKSPRNRPNTSTVGWSSPRLSSQFSGRKGRLFNE